jgi:hypothetical protein
VSTRKVGCTTNGDSRAYGWHRCTSRWDYFNREVGLGIGENLCLTVSTISNDFLRRARKRATEGLLNATANDPTASDPIHRPNYRCSFLYCCHNLLEPAFSLGLFRIPATVKEACFEVYRSHAVARFKALHVPPYWKFKSELTWPLIVAVCVLAVAVLLTEEWLRFTTISYIFLLQWWLGETDDNFLSKVFGYALITFLWCIGIDLIAYMFFGNPFLTSTPRW